MVTTGLPDHFRRLRRGQPDTPQNPQKPRLSGILDGWKIGAGEGIRTLDPNLGKVNSELFPDIPLNSPAIQIIAISMS